MKSMIKFYGEKNVITIINVETFLTFFYSTPSTEGVESTRGNSVCLSVCLSVCASVYPFVRNHFLLLRIFNNLMF